MFSYLEETCDPRKQRFDGYGLTTGKDGSHRLTGIKSLYYKRYLYNISGITRISFYYDLFNSHLNSKVLDWPKAQE